MTDGPWREWQREMERAGLGGRLDGFPSVVRGQDFLHVIDLPGDYHSDAFAAELRDSPADDATVLATFTVTVGAYAGGETPVSLALSAATVNAITLDDADGDYLADMAFFLTQTPSGDTKTYLAMAGVLPIVG